MKGLEGMEAQQTAKMIKVGTITPEIEKICRSKKTGEIRKSNKVYKKSPFVGYPVYRVIVHGEKKYRIGQTKFAIGRKEYLSLRKLGVIEPVSQTKLEDGEPAPQAPPLERSTLPSIEPPDADKQYSDEVIRKVCDSESGIDADAIETSTFFDGYVPVFDMGDDKRNPVLSAVADLFGGISDAVDRFGFNMKERAIRNLEKDRPSIKAGHKHYMR